MILQDRNNIKIKGKKIVILGLGLSGIAAASLAAHKEANVFVSDQNSSDNLIDSLEELKALNIKGELGKHSNQIYEADLWVISPGIPQDSEIIAKAKEKNIPIVSEIEFSSWFTEAPIIAITGSNGKTTTAHVLEKMVQTNEIHGLLAGNVGIPFSHMVLNDLNKPDAKRVWVLEISSFQLEFIVHFKPFISIFLNITPDHLNRYASMKEYISAKMNMWSNQNKEDFIIYNANDNILVEEIAESTSRKIAFGLNYHPEAIFQPNQTKIYNEKHTTLIEMDEILLPGKHNLSNALAASTAAHLIGISNDKICSVLSTFSGVPHRLEKISEINGVTYINDSKATNLDAVNVALQSFSQPIILLLGGVDKGGDFRSLLPHTHKYLKTVIAFGQAKELILLAFGDAVRSTSAMDLNKALTLAQNYSQPGDIILLSP
ncbi:MAG: UDP-N-acetylmuramoyl-L-alanine--D-glutamate ligase, partial [Candidatus Marinimicrobia bacterium]|nr:UDP-N-acetylmuramoyl-L-alanine--D-glutamate ligase [Candidatus Neomarinimicrobiota bacterium]